MNKLFNRGFWELFKVFILQDISTMHRTANFNFLDQIITLIFE